MTRRIPIFATILVLISLFFVTPALAHGTAKSFPKDVGQYTIEMEYEDEAVTAGITTPFVFRLLDQKTKDAVPFDSALIRFEKKSDQSTQFVARVVQDELQEGSARVSAMLDQGDYIVSVSFYKKDAKLTEVNYDLNVVPGDTQGQFPLIPVASFAGGIIIGFLGSKILKGSKKE